MARRIFLEHLEPENPEALSVIEGLRLPDWIILLPMPAAPVLRSTPERTLLRDYWGRRFEGEIARAWQMARDDNQDLADFGPVALETSIGRGAVDEAREILIQGGISGAAEGPSELCRAFVARVVRLRYFAPGARGCYFPAVGDWAAVDRWLEASGLDLPAPLSGSRLPLALERGRPTITCGAPPVLLPFPPTLPFGRSDPDQHAATAFGPAPAMSDFQVPASTTPPKETPTVSEEAGDGIPSEIQALCLQALRRGAFVRRSVGPLSRIRESLDVVTFPLIRGLLQSWVSVSDAVGAILRLSISKWGLWTRLTQLQYASAAAQRAEWNSRFATALGHLSNARRCYRRLVTERLPNDPVDRTLDQRQRAAAESFADFLAVNWRLSHAATGDLSELIRRLVAQHGPAARKAQALLGHLETVLLEGRATYYRISVRTWLAKGKSGRRWRQVLPFQGTLKSLAALEAARHLLDELPWLIEDQDRFAAPLASLAEHIGERLEETLRPRIQEALEAADFASDSPRGRLAATRLKDSLAGIIRRRGHLKLADVRDLINRDVLSLPDLRLAELWRGDRLGRFDRTAAQALPGVYQRGELYVKGLQRLSAPLFGTRIGRRALRLALLPALAAWVLLQITDLVWGLFTPAGGHPVLTNPTAILLLGGTLSAAANTHSGRRAVRLLWRAPVALIRLLFVTAPERFLHWQPVAWLLGLGLVRDFLDRLLLPLGLGMLLLLPVTALWLLAMPEGPGTAAWIATSAIAFALGTLLRETPEGRRRLDDWTTGWHRLRHSLHHERFLNLITPIMELFRGILRTFAEILHRIRTRLSPRLGEPQQVIFIKALAAPLWAACEALIQFCAVVLIEPQVNPVKHFPAVTLGHKLMLPFLPSLSARLHAELASVLPEVIVLPLEAATILLLPGVFGFLFWELKENWGLYGNNRVEPVPQARLDSHGETLNGMLRRGFHSGTIPKAFDRLREVLDDQIRRETPEPRQLRRALAPLAQIDTMIRRFGEQELAGPLRDACPNGLVTMAEPRIASQGIELRAGLQSADGVESVELSLKLAIRGAALVCTPSLTGPARQLSAECRGNVAKVADWIARRCGATAEPIAISENPTPEIQSPPRGVPIRSEAT
jgi:hypothetical protein